MELHKKSTAAETMTMICFATAESKHIEKFSLSEQTKGKRYIAQLL